MIVGLLSGTLRCLKKFEFLIVEIFIVGYFTSNGKRLDISG